MGEGARLLDLEDPYVWGGGVKPAGVGVAGSPLRPNLGDASPGDFFEGTVLLRCTPGPTIEVGVPGLCALLEALEFFDDTDTFLRRVSYFLRLSAPPLALEADRRSLVAGVGVGAGAGAGSGGGVTFVWISLTVCGSAAVPFIPNKKWS